MNAKAKNVRTPAHPLNSAATSPQVVFVPQGAALAAKASRFTTLRETQDIPSRKVDRLGPTKDSKEIPARPRPANPNRDSSRGNSWRRTGSGRQFTVGNIGYGGRIYLRPVVRPGNQRSNASPVQPLYLFPLDIPKGSADVDATRQRPSSSIGTESLFPSTLIPKRAEKRDKPLRTVKSPDPSPPKARTIVRAHSFSTIADHELRPSLERSGQLQVLMHGPTPSVAKFDQSSGEQPALPLIEVPIPHYKLGTPQFATTGAAVLRSSLYTSSKDEPHAFDASNLARGRMLQTSSLQRSSNASRRHSDAFPRPLFDAIGIAEVNGPRFSAPGVGGQQPFEASAASIYDYLTVNPNDPSVVRYAHNTLDIVAATPSRLIAHITSPSFLDYELLSDFFLTFRSFVRSHKLVSLLIVRLKWAVNRADDFGRIVRVRTFVALRHWVLNYFTDDFSPDLQLRVQFCELVNALYDELRTRRDGGAGDVKIIGELKKCWRRTCALHWADPDLLTRESPEDAIHAGDAPVPEESTTASVLINTMSGSQATEASKAAPTVPLRSVKLSPAMHAEEFRKAQYETMPSLASGSHLYPHSNRTETMNTPGAVRLSPSSERSAHVQSCSFPRKQVNRLEFRAESPLFPHPVPAPMLITTSPASSKAPNPVQDHARITNFNERSIAPGRSRSATKSGGEGLGKPEVYVPPGSLVRGVLYQPDSPYFDLKSVGSLRSNQSTAQVEMPDPSGAHTPKSPIPSNPGVKKLFGSVRRALGSKQMTNRSSSQADHSPVSFPATNAHPDSRTNFHHARKSAQRTRMHVRIDLLVARVAETFREAVEAGMEEDRAVERDILVATENESGLQDEIGSRTRDPRFDRSLTIGSRSIVIMDDTNPDFYMMSGALKPPSSPASRGTMSMYEEYVTDATRTFRNEREKKSSRNVRTTKNDLSAGHRDLPTSAVTAPATYIPAGHPKSKAAPELPAIKTSAPTSEQRRGRESSSSMAAVPSLRKCASYHSGHGVPRTRSKSRPTSASEGADQSADGDTFILRKPSVRQLRRKPGGDLKAVTSVHDLEQPQRLASTKPIVTVTKQTLDSITLATSPTPIPEGHSTSLETSEMRNKRGEEGGDDGGGGEQKSISLIQTHSSQPNLRPSFEAEVAKLAALPDDEHDDGGTEAALLKLEGRYVKTKGTATSPDKSAFTHDHLVRPARSEVCTGGDVVSEAEDLSKMKRHHPKHGQEIGAVGETSLVQDSSLSSSPRRPSQSSDVAIPTLLPASVESAVESEDSYSSIPLLERSNSDPPKPKLQSLDRSVTRAPDPSSKSLKEQQDHPDSASSSIKYAVETDSMCHTSRGETVPRSPTMHQSFLFDDTQEDLSKEYDARCEKRFYSESEGVRSFFDDEAVDSDDPVSSGFAHPLRHPENPPVKMRDQNETSPTLNPSTFTHEFQAAAPKPAAKLHFQLDLSSNPLDATKSQRSGHQRAKASEVAHPASHMPFIMAFDAQIIARQFTLIEKDALDEVDWKELIELRWKQTSPTVSDWVDYLRSQDPHGVDLVIARFNLVVKWVISEIVLTEILDERVNCVVHYIHIASHCRRMRNYATMYQITVALLSADCARLKTTWDHVAAVDMQIFRELEKVVQPVKNFHKLRSEMETAIGDEGCIPFIGIYTRDLVYNAQKPPYITTPPLNPSEPLVNFERHHNAATIVKSLLRLLESSSRYQFQVEPTIIGKCLWLASIPDDEISARSKRLE